MNNPRTTMSDYPQEVIDTLRNVIAAQKKRLAEMEDVFEADGILIKYWKDKYEALKGGS
jgi:hypothetical protein